jgi:ATP-binding cassette subfamily C protein CydD
VPSLSRAPLPGAGSLARGLAPAVLAGALAGAAAVAQAWLLSRAIDDAFLAGAPLVALVPTLAALAFVAAARASLLWGQEVAAQGFSARARAAVRDRLSRTILARGPAYVAGERAGELASTLTGGIDALDAYLAQFLPQSALAGLVPALVLAAVAWTDPLSGLVLLLTFPLVPLFMWLVGEAARKETRRQWATLSRLAARFQDALAGLATLRAFGRAEAEVRALERASGEYRAVTMRVLRTAFLSALVLEALATLATAVVAVEVGLRLLHGRIDFRPALFVLVLAPEFYRPLRALGAAFHAGMPGREAAARIGAITAERRALAAPALLCETPPAARAPTPSALAAATPPSVRFERVSFSYDGAAGPALDGLTLEIPSGATLALLGPTGSGKTTATSLLLRWIEPSDGRILVDGHDLAGTSPEAWRRRVAWVPQRPRLFHATLRENLLVARPGATRDEIEDALERAALGGLVSALPLGLETPLGESGERLSGGEAQRVALARAFLKDAPVLVLDEPTAQLDLDTEARVLDAVRALRRGRTVLVVAHRLTTLAAADRVAILSGGRIVEAGAPPALAAAGGVYGRLVAAWGGGE